MKLDNPKLTAFVLGELSPAEQAEFEQEMQSDREIAAEIEETREIARILREGLGAERGGMLAEHHRDAIFREARLISEDQPESTGSSGTFAPLIIPHDGWWNRPRPWQAIAACAVAGLAAYSMFVNVGAHRREALTDSGDIIVQIPVENGTNVAGNTEPTLISPKDGPAKGTVTAGLNPMNAGGPGLKSRGPQVVSPGTPDWRSGASVGVKPGPLKDENVSTYLKERLKEAEGLKAGATYEEFARVFQPSVGNPGQFEMIRVPSIKVDAEFAAGTTNAQGNTPAANARLKQVSKPYLE
jgi:hypothetical protein